MRISIARTRSAHLKNLREVTTYTQRRAMNAKLSAIFRKAKVSITPKAWTLAQVTYVKGGEKSATQLVAKLAK